MIESVSDQTSDPRLRAEILHGRKVRRSQMTLLDIGSSLRGNSRIRRDQLGEGDFRSSTICFKSRLARKYRWVRSLSETGGAPSWAISPDSDPRT
jgi:hypothetical protein